MTEDLTAAITEAGYTRQRNGLHALNLAANARCDAKSPLFRARYIASAILWSERTGRVAGAVSLTLRRMTGREAMRLVVAAAGACDTTGDLPAYLNQRFS